ncbi:MAG: SDR family NAD(P)-dependent oxidoreductase [Acidobacteriota bacterium]|nr:SDR family NAD(P)-dependent oxidoreductase [Acidobacteriota bacterium]
MAARRRDLANATAVVTGGGGGIGGAMAAAFAGAGMNVVLADIDGEAAERAAAALASEERRVLATTTDVSRSEDLEALAELAYAQFGEVNVLCNNAGVMTFEPVHRLRESDWRWVLSVNLFGVIHGVQAFLPRMKEQQGWGHIVNTASILGLKAQPRLAPYAASKYAVVAISESLRAEREDHGLGISVLCPGMVATQIVRSERNRQAEFGEATTADTAWLHEAVSQGLDPERVAELVREAVETDAFWIQTDPSARVESEQRLAEILESFDR